MVTPAVSDGFETRGTWTLWLGVGSAVSLVAAEYLLLPEAQTVPLPAWLLGGVGVVAAASGTAFAVVGSHCSPQAHSPGSRIDQGCLSGTSDVLFGPLLLLASVPLLNLPLTYMLRSVFASEKTLSVTVAPGMLLLSGRM
jgi:hypothetical protein